MDKRECGKRGRFERTWITCPKVISFFFAFVVTVVVGCSSGGDNARSVNTPPPASGSLTAAAPTSPIKSASPADKRYIQASVRYLDSANADGTEMATIMAGAASGTSTLDEIHAAIRKNVTREKQRYSAYLAARGTVPPDFRTIDTHISGIHDKSMTAFSSYLSYWTTGDLNAITRGSDQYQAAVLEMNSTIAESTAILKTMK